MVGDEVDGRGRLTICTWTSMSLAGVGAFRAVVVRQLVRERARRHGGVARFADEAVVCARAWAVEGDGE